MYEKTTLGARAVAGGMAITGLIAGVISTLYIAGAFGLSTATATQIVNAYEVGGWALTAVLIVFSGGTAAAITIALKKMAESLGKKALVA